MLTSLVKLIGKAFVRLRSAAVNPFRRVVRRIQQMFNVNLVTAKLITPINKKIRSILAFKPKSEEDYITIGRFWIAKKLIHFLILACCAAVFIYFTWFAPRISDTVETTSVTTTTYYDYDDLDLGEYSGRANIRAANKNVVYVGDISNGVCTGTGILRNQDGVLIYQGMFENNCYSGEGTLYYSNGEVMYEGKFADNTFNGVGKYYSLAGDLVYEGNFVNGAYDGEGITYDEMGNIIYEGEFQGGNYHGIGTKYYSSGIKEYEGDFYMGKYQGVGTIYSQTGKLLFTGNFARNDIHYESILGCTLEDAMKMFDENPKIYYSDSQTCFYFQGAGVILEGDCLVRLQKSSTLADSDGEWFIPGEETSDELEEVEDDSQAVVFPEDPDAAVVLDEVSENSAVTLPILSESSKYNTYFYLSSQEWQMESNLDKSKVMITKVCSLNQDFDVSFLADTSPIPSNGATYLPGCVAIDQIRLEKPTAFSNISFEQTSRNSTYIYVSGINLAEAVYAQLYEKDGVRYQLNYEVDDPEDLMYITLESY